MHDFAVFQKTRRLNWGKYAVDKSVSFFTSTQAVTALHPDKCESLLNCSAVTITTGGA